ncbi:MAG: peptidylprolyl isomerase [Candidatus Peregrinibacteria bacterium]
MAHIPQHPLPETGDEIAILKTNHGNITLRFFHAMAPKTVENFLTHAKNGYYNGIIFHRVIEGFMMQGGDPTGTGTGGESIWGKPFADECHPHAKNMRGSISMANAGPGTNGSQFFINQNDNTFLDGKHTVFGEIIEGMDILDTICEQPVDRHDRPHEDVVIKGIEVQEYEEGKN